MPGKVGEPDVYALKKTAAVKNDKKRTGPQKKEDFKKKKGGRYGNGGSTKQ